MQGGFQNPPVGNQGILTRPAIQSPDFRQGPPIVGWSIDRDGNVFISGTFSGNNFILSGDGLFLYNGTPTAGNLVCAITQGNASGTDQFGNTYSPGGISLVALASIQNILDVIDTSGNTLLSLDNLGDIIAQTLTANTDLIVGGNSLLSTLLPDLPQGEIARANVFSSSLPAPAVATASEFFLYELDVQLSAGRSYLLVLEPFQVSLGGAGKVQTKVYATTDGSQPTNASTLICQAESRYPSTSNLTIRLNTLCHPFTSSAGNLWRFLVSISSNGVDGGGAPTMQITALGSNPGDDGEGNTNCRFSVYDMGPSIVNTGRGILSTASGSGGGTQNFTKTYTATATHSYQGSNGSQPNQKINDNGKCYQGDDQLGDNGNCKTWIVFNSSQIASDLSGATINSVKVKLNNNHSWFFSGLTVALGWDTKSSFGATASNPAGAGIDAVEYSMNDGQTLTKDVTGNGIGTAFQSGGATSLVLYKSGAGRQYYGYFAGSGQSGPPQLIISYTK